jgi:hypothetical protein
MRTRFGSVLLQYAPTSRTAITWVLVSRAKAVAAVTMADNRTEAVLPTGGREMAGPPVWLETLTAIRALRRAALG